MTNKVDIVHQPSRACMGDARITMWEARTTGNMLGTFSCLVKRLSGAGQLINVTVDASAGNTMKYQRGLGSHCSEWGMRPVPFNTIHVA